MLEFIFVRHAEREFSVRQNASLTDKGRNQASALAEQIQSGQLPKIARLISSPKARCLETLQIMGRQSEVEVESDPLLDEQCSTETIMEFRRRIEIFQQRMQESQHSGAAVYVCSHSDWLQEAMSVLPCESDELTDIYRFPCAEPFHLICTNGFWSRKR